MQRVVELLVYEEGLFLHVNNIANERIEEQELKMKMHLRIKIQISAHKLVTIRLNVHWLFITLAVHTPMHTWMYGNHA